MRFYVSGPVVEALEGRSALEATYKIIRDYLSGHTVELPIRIKSLDELSPESFYQTIFDKIKSSNGVIAILADNDQSGPVEAAIAASLYVPLCIIDMSKYAPRLIRGLPQKVKITKVDSGDLYKQVTSAIGPFVSLIG